MSVLYKGIIASSAIVAVFLTSTSCFNKIKSDKGLTARAESFKYSNDLVSQNYYLLQKPAVAIEAQEKIRHNAEQILSLAPINDAPFIQLAFLDIHKQEYQNTRSLLDEAQRRNPRNKRALKALSLINLYEGDAASSVEHLNTFITRSKGDQLAEPLKLLSQIFKTPDGFDAISAFLATGPTWGKSFLQNEIKISNEDVIKSLALPLNTFANSKINETKSTDLQLKYINRLFSLGFQVEAYNHWRALPIHDGIPNRNSVFDDSFSGQSLDSVFSWNTRNAKKYFTEIDRTDGLYASFNDIKTRKLTSQVLFLSSNTDYTVSVDFRRNYKDRNGYFAWEISCLPGQALVQINIDDSNTDKSKLSADFQIPATGCDIQEVKLLGHSGKYRGRIALTTQSFKVTAKK